jgi:hypothetical protein
MTRLRSACITALLLAALTAVALLGPAWLYGTLR